MLTIGLLDDRPSGPPFSGRTGWGGDLLAGDERVERRDDRGGRSEVPPIAVLLHRQPLRLSAVGADVEIP